jgi:hypothetical protein
MQQLSIQQTVVGPTSGSTTPTTQSSDVHTVQSKTQKGPQHPREKNKGKGKKGSGGNDKNPNKNVEGEKSEKRKVKFPCNICGDDHLTHQCPKMEEAQCLIKLQQQQQPVVLQNLFPQGKTCRLALPLPIRKGALLVHLCQMDISHSLTWSILQS